MANESGNRRNQSSDRSPIASNVDDANVLFSSLSTEASNTLTNDVAVIEPVYTLSVPLSCGSRPANSWPACSILRDQHPQPSTKPTSKHSWA